MSRIQGKQRVALLCGVSAIGLALAAPGAFAQEAQDPETTEVEEVIVTGIRAQLRSAQQIKQNSEVIVDS
ncbi:MAG: hypothetical protein ACK4GB_09140, partial [Tepidimonas sp.]